GINSPLGHQSLRAAPRARGPSAPPRSAVPQWAYRAVRLAGHYQRRLFVARDVDRQRELVVVDMDESDFWPAGIPLGDGGPGTLRECRKARPERAYRPHRGGSHWSDSAERQCRSAAL